MMKTLGQVRDEMLRLAYPDDHLLRSWADALSAHIAAMGEPAVPGVSSLSALVVKWRRLGNAGVAGNIWGQCADELSTLIPPASGDWDKVREVITELNAWPVCPPSPLMLADELANKLTAALPESQP